MRTVLITGAAGFIGANFTHYWLAQHAHDRVIALDALTYAGNTWNLRSVWENPRLHFVKGDICDQALVESLLREHRVDTLVHFAAESHVDRSITGPDAFITTNIVGTHSLLKAAKKVWLDGPQKLAHHFHHVSTDEVYGTLGPQDPPFTESTPYAPNSPYAASKASSDHLVRAYHHTYGLRVTTSNCSNNYGPFHFPEKLIPLIIHNALAGKPLPIYGDGQQIRDWLFVKDHCSAIRRVLAAGRVGEVYNIGGNNEMANIDVVHHICDLLDSLKPRTDAVSYRSQITFVKDRPGHDKRYAIDASKISGELGWEPSETFASGIRKTVEWYLENQAWVLNITSGAYRDWVAKQYDNH